MSSSTPVCRIRAGAGSTARPRSWPSSCWTWRSGDGCPRGRSGGGPGGLDELLPDTDIREHFAAGCPSTARGHGGHRPPGGVAAAGTQSGRVPGHHPVPAGGGALRLRPEHRGGADALLRGAADRGGRRPGRQRRVPLGPQGQPASTGQGPRRRQATGTAADPTRAAHRPDPLARPTPQMAARRTRRRCCSTAAADDSPTGPRAPSSPTSANTSASARTPPPGAASDPTPCGTHSPPNSCAAVRTRSWSPTCSGTPAWTPSAPTPNPTTPTENAPWPCSPPTSE